MRHSGRCRAKKTKGRSSLGCRCSRVRQLQSMAFSSFALRPSGSGSEPSHLHPDQYGRRPLSQIPLRAVPRTACIWRSPVSQISSTGFRARCPRGRGQFNSVFAPRRRIFVLARLAVPGVGAYFAFDLLKPEFTDMDLTLAACTQPLRDPPSHVCIHRPFRPVLVCR